MLAELRINVPLCTQHGRLRRLRVFLQCLVLIARSEMVNQKTPIAPSCRARRDLYNGIKMSKPEVVRFTTFVPEPSLCKL